MSHFYRYLRPIYICPTLGEVLEKNGGICFRLSPIAKNTYFVSCSLCKDSRQFDKVVARKIADARAIEGIGVVMALETPSPENIVKGFLEYSECAARKSVFSSEWQSELDTLIKKINLIMHRTDSARAESVMLTEVIEASNLKEAYENSARK